MTVNVDPSGVSIKCNVLNYYFFTYFLLYRFAIYATTKTHTIVDIPPHIPAIIYVVSLLVSTTITTGTEMYKIYYNIVYEIQTVHTLLLINMEYLNFSAQNRY